MSVDLYNRRYNGEAVLNDPDPREKIRVGGASSRKYSDNYDSIFRKKDKAEEQK